MSNYLTSEECSLRQGRARLFYGAAITIALLTVVSLLWALRAMILPLMIGVIIGLAYYLGSETLANSGQVFNLNPVLINWLPSLALCLVTVIALLRIR